MDKSEDAFRTISEAAEDLDLPQHVLRFWETRFPQIRPMKRGGGRRYYRPDDVELLRAIRQLLYSDGYTIKGVQRILKERGVRAVLSLRADDAAGGPELPQGALQQSAIAPRGPTVSPPWSDQNEIPTDAPAFLGPADQEPARGATALASPPLSAAASPHAILAGPDAQMAASFRPARRSAPEWTTAQHRRLVAIAAELAECRRILSAANI
ncbi:MAG: MerR family transcriptional regulator [Beijerinckiaceae bacterium]|nr:MerR family transcriptional regulator [Beijerinckiaceae bacterium]